MTVSDLLASARKEHELYRRCVPHMRAGVGGKAVLVAGNDDQAIAHVKEALRLRLEADAMDPTRDDQAAWLEDLSLKHRQADLIDWYRQVIADREKAAAVPANGLA